MKNMVIFNGYVESEAIQTIRMGQFTYLPSGVNKDPLTSN